MSSRILTNLLLLVIAVRLIIMINQHSQIQEIEITGIGISASLEKRFGTLGTRSSLSVHIESEPLEVIAR